METKNKKLSLSPLTFDEALTDILKIKPEPKPSKGERSDRGLGGKKAYPKPQKPPSGRGGPNLGKRSPMRDPGR